MVDLVVKNILESMGSTVHKPFTDNIILSLKFLFVIRGTMQSHSVIHKKYATDKKLF